MLVHRTLKYKLTLRVCTLLMLCLIQTGYGQQKDTTISGAEDSTQSAFVRTVVEAGARDRKKTEESYQEGKISMRQAQVGNALIQTAQEVKIYLDAGQNLSLIKKNIDNIAASFELVKDGVLVSKGTAQTDRNLTISSVIINQLINETQAYKMQTDRYAEDLMNFRSKLDSLLSDPAVYAFPRDSVKLVRYLTRLKVIVAQGNPIDNALNESLERSAKLQNEVDNMLFKLKVAEEQIERYRTELSNINIKREFPNIWEGVGFSRPFSEIIRFSIAKEKVALTFYAEDNIAKIILLFCVVALVWLAIRSLKKHVGEHERTRALAQQLIMKNPLAAACLIVLSIGQFIFINAPFIFSFCIWTIQIVTLLIVIHRFISAFWFRFWIGASLLFLLACLDNFILQASRTERWFMMILALSGIIYGIYFLSARKEIAMLKERTIVIFIRFLVLFEGLSLIMNIFGRYNLSKTMLSAGYTGMVTAIMFIWVIRLINEGLGAASELYRHPERKLLYLNFNRIGNKTPLILRILLVIGWCILVGRNFYFFKKIAVPFQAFLHKQRTIGDYTFAVDGVFLFLLIAGCSLLISKLVSLFSADPNAEHGSVSGNQQKRSVGSWILLIRIAIISIGLFLAFAASGLPLDKITIVLGALSVGIGLGLQGLVSNLVSGLIIAFERPVNVGDHIEINGKSGTMKSIGFRSSIVTLSDGACLIVPNGDLLSTHLINWSISKNARRLVIPVGVAYGSSLELVADLLKSVANKDERITRYPEAVAAARHFGDYAIAFELIFWIKNPSESLAVASSVIAGIIDVFKENGIIIPIAQRTMNINNSEAEDNNASS